MNSVSSVTPTTGLHLGLGIFLVVALVAAVIWRASTRKQREDREAKTSAMIDSMQLKRASINTQYIEKDLFPTINQLVYSFYALDPQSMPTQHITQNFYMDWYNRLKREFDLGIRKQVHSYQMTKARVVKQENSSMYAVTQLEVEAQFSVDFTYFHSTGNKRVQKQYKQRFVFVNTNDAWPLDSAKPETDVSETETYL